MESNERMLMVKGNVFKKVSEITGKDQILRFAMIFDGVTVQQCCANDDPPMEEKCMVLIEGDTVPVFKKVSELNKPQDKIIYYSLVFDGVVPEFAKITINSNKES